MKLIDGLKLQGLPAEIPDCSRDDLPELFKDLGFKVGVEVGVFEGSFTEVLAKGGFQIYGIDPWKIYRDYGNRRQHTMDERERTTRERLAKYPNVTILKETSMEAVKRFKPESIDFVYIDGNHLFRYMADDLFEWSIRVKQGGIITGHDYAYFKSRSLCGGCHVHEVVDAYVKALRIENFWVLGRKTIESPTERRDHYRSWVILKNYKTTINSEYEE